MRYSSFRAACCSLIVSALMQRNAETPLTLLPKPLRERAEDSISQLRSAVSEFKNVCYANSLGSESVVLTDLIWSAVPEIEVFTIDTGRLHPETYDPIKRLQKRFGRA